jgi:hypothetical protein
MNARAFPTGWVIFACSVILLGFLYVTYFNKQVALMSHAYAQCPTDYRLTLTIAYDKPPLVSEVYKMRDNNGLSGYSYSVLGTSGRLITITARPVEMLEVPDLLNKLDADGARSLGSAAPAGDTSVHYTLALFRKEMYGSGNCRSASRTITFTDPHYWATTPAREYHIDLSKGTPKTADDLIHMQGTSLAVPAYQEIVDDVRAFGSNEFRVKIAAAQARARSGK